MPRNSDISNEDNVHDHEVYLTTASDEIEADILESLLKSNGIPVLKKHRGAGAYLSILMGKSYSGIDIYVPSKSYDIARELINIDTSADFDADDDLSNEANYSVNDDTHNSAGLDNIDAKNK